MTAHLLCGDCERPDPHNCTDIDCPIRIPGADGRGIGGSVAAGVPVVSARTDPPPSIHQSVPSETSRRAARRLNETDHAGRRRPPKTHDPNAAQIEHKTHNATA